MKKNFLVLLFVLIQNALFSQSSNPIDTADYQLRKSFLETFKKNNEAYIKLQKSKYPGKAGSEISKQYSGFYKNFEKEIQHKDFLFKSSFNEMLNAILAEIQSKNSQVSGDFKVLIAKDNVPNASCLPDGTFIINMGVFNWMDSEDEIAAILSHEIAHKLEEHSIKGIIAEYNEGKKDAEIVKQLGTQTENKRDKAFDLMKERLYKLQGKNRKNEIQADSLGYVLFSKTKYKKEAFVEMMKTLRDFDTISPRMVKPETYKKLFDLPNQPFKEKWMKEEDFSLYNYDFYKEKLSKDSLSSHPEFTERIATLEGYFPELKSEKIAEKNTLPTFQALKKLARHEILPNFFQSEDFGLGIYVAMQMYQDDYEVEYVKYWIGKFFSEVEKARKNYNLNRYLDRVEPKNQGESYRKFLSFMWNLSLDEISTIADYYEKKP